MALAWFVFTVLGGLALHMFGVYSISVAVLSRISPRDFFRRIRTVMLTAFSTSSSNATLPTALRVSEENLGVPRDINTFVLTVGATANQNGTALYEGVTVLFLAQLAGVNLTLGQQFLVAYLAILGGIGTAGVPSGSIPFIIVVLTTIGVHDRPLPDPPPCAEAAHGGGSAHRQPRLVPSPVAFFWQRGRVREGARLHGIPRFPTRPDRAT